MNTVKVAINGFGRIGRFTCKLLSRHQHINVVAINDLMDTPTLVHLLKYDSVHRRFDASVTYSDNDLFINEKKIGILGEKDPKKLPWKELDVDVVIEATGKFTKREDAEGHLHAGAKKVIISAPAQGNLPTVVLGVNDHILTGSEKIISNASCTTNCLAPMIKALDDALGLEKGFISTVHSYTADQNLQDAPHRDLRRARAAACSIIPTTTNAAKAVELVLPSVRGKIHAMAYRVPVPDGSLTELNAVLSRETTVEEINAVMKKAALGSMKGYLEYLEEPLVSTDIIGNPHSCIYDAGLTVVNGNFVKIIGWYDNEAGYSNRVVDLIQKITSSTP